jgi:hypothetical protein
MSIAMTEKKKMDQSFIYGWRIKKGAVDKKCHAKTMMSIIADKALK